MSNFKVGDKVDRVVAPLPFKILEGGGPYTVTAVSPSAHFIQINLNTHYGDHYPWDARNFKLVEQDDPLPPAPESVRYTTLQYDWQDKYNDQHLIASPDSFSNGVCIRIQGSTTSQRNKDMALSVFLSPDEILQLCHDLRRIAMEIKRKGCNG